jgi:hypothetical protein
MLGNINLINAIKFVMFRTHAWNVKFQYITTVGHSTTSILYEHVEARCSG